MHPRALVVVLLFLAATSFVACGSAQDRPVVVDTFPAQGAEVPGTVDQVRFTFDDPVTILNPSQIAISTGGVTIPVITSPDPDDPHTIVLRPARGEFWRVGRTTITIRPGWEVNADEHYRLEDYVLRFDMGQALPVYFGVPAPASVVQTDGLDFAWVATVPTPGGRAPAGLTCSTVAVDQRTWVQLADGGGTGEALAWFHPGAAAMTPVSLTHDAGGDLMASSQALQVDADGAFLYLAYRDTGLERVRLHKVDVATGTEIDSLLLSPAASASTSPQGLSLTSDGLYVDVACAADTGARLVAVDLDSFTEIDLGPDAGVDGLPLPSGAGPTVNVDALTTIAPLLAAEAVLTVADTVALEVEDLPSIVLGNPTSLGFTPDRRYIVEGLSGYVDDEAVSYRSRTSPANERSVVIDDDTGAGNGPASAILDLAWITGSTRLIALLDNDAAIFLRFLPSGVDQEDLDDTTPEAAVDLSASAPGATLVAVPPPSVTTAP